MDKIFLITGGSGFIGSALVRYLVQNTQHKIINVDKLTYASRYNGSLNVVAKSRRYCFEKIDICDHVLIDSIIKKYQPNVIVHLAAESHVDRSIKDSGSFVQTNIFGTYNLLESARSYYNSMTEVKKAQFLFVHVSTDEVYGDLTSPENKRRRVQLFDEHAAYKPSSPYSASKAAADHLVRSWHRTYGLPAIVTNCSNNYGPYQYPEKLIPMTILNAIQGRAIPIYGNGEQIRDWLYVEDHIRALYLVITRGKIGETYNIGGANEIRNIDIVKMICTFLDEIKPENKKYSLLISHVSDRKGHDQHYGLDCEKIKNELSWTPQESIEYGLRKTIVWYLNNVFY